MIVDRGIWQFLRPVPRLQALTVEKELSFEYDDIGMGESDDEVGDDETPKGTGQIIWSLSSEVRMLCISSIYLYILGNMNVFDFIRSESQRIPEVQSHYWSTSNSTGCSWFWVSVYYWKNKAAWLSKYE